MPTHSSLRAGTWPVMALWIVAAAPCLGAPVEARIDGQALVYMKDGLVDGCGIRVIVVDLPANRSAPITAYDASFNLKAPDQAVVRAASTDATLVDYESGRPERRKAVAPESFWFKAGGARATAPNERMAGRMVSGGDAGSVIYLSDLAPVMALFESQRGRRPILIGVKRPDTAAEKVFTGTIEMSSKDSAQVASCVSELARRSSAR